GSFAINATAVSDMHHRQPSRFADRPQSARPKIHRRAAQSGLARRHHLRANQGRVALSGRRARSLTRKIVGWAMRDHMRAELTLAALTMAIKRQKPPPGLIHHSDRGRQYAARDYRKVLGAAATIHCTSRKGNCWDNAAMESCFGTLKTELVHQACYPTRDAAGTTC